MEPKDLLSHLNGPQRLAVTTTRGAVLILAGPGSGKTRVITHRIAYLVRHEKVDPSTILAVTFTNRAAKETLERLGTLLSKSEAKAMRVGTFHSLCARILRSEPVYLSRYGLNTRYSIYDRVDGQHLLKQALTKVDLSDMNLDQSRPPRIAEIQECISYAKARMFSPQRLAEDAKKDIERLAARIWHPYDLLLRQHNAVDFDDLLLLCEQALRTQPERLVEYQRRYTWLSVDEYQDCNLPQYKLVRLLAYGTDERHESLGNICVVADDNQMIYSWRGASIENITQFERDFPQRTLVMLEENYRSTRTILAAAQGIVSHNLDRKAKNLWTQNPVGEAVVVYTAEDDRAGAAPTQRAETPQYVERCSHSLSDEYAVEDT